MDITQEGNIGDLDEADQLPVKDPRKDANPICYICSADMTEFDGRTKLWTGIYSAESVHPHSWNPEGGGWCRFYRMSMPALFPLTLFNPLDMVLMQTDSPLPPTETYMPPVWRIIFQQQGPWLSYAPGAVGRGRPDHKIRKQSSHV